MNDMCDAALADLSGIPAATTDRDEALVESFDAFKGFAEQSLQALRESTSVETARVEKLAERTTEFGAQLSEEKNRLTSLTSDFQIQFSAAQESRSTANVATNKLQADEFAALIRKYATSLTEQEQALDEEAKERGVAFDASIASLADTQRARAQAILEKMETDRAAVEKLVGVIGNLGVTSGYLRAANLARLLTWIWQAATVLTLCVLTILAVHYFLPAADATATFSWQSLGSRILITATLGFLAAYAAAQAEKASSAERRNRRMALELEAIGPFLAPLPVEEQNKFRMQIGERSFGHDPEAEVAKKTHSWSMFGHLVKEKEFKELIAAVIKATKGS